MSLGSRGRTRWSNRLGVWVYRRSHGRLVGPGRGTTIALITVPGRRTGTPRTTSIGLHSYESAFLAVGTGGGSAREPDWFQNLRVARCAEVEIGSHHHEVVVRVTEDDERDRLWTEVVLVQAPWRAKYQQKSGRVVPVALLTSVRGAERSPQL